MFYDYFDNSITGRLILAGNENGLCHLSFIDGKNPLFIKKEWVRDHSCFKPVTDQLTAYFKGELQQFDLPLLLSGSAFQQKVWQALQRIPYGQAASYTQIAAKTGNSKAMRAVGAACGKNPIAIIIPCHRVIGKNGALTGFAGGLEIKQRLLELEMSLQQKH